MPSGFDPLDPFDPLRLSSGRQCTRIPDPADPFASDWEELHKRSQAYEEELLAQIAGSTPKVASPTLGDELQSTRRSLYEHLLFQSLAPPFDDVPMRRVFPLFLYTPQTIDSLMVGPIVTASGCTVVYSYPYLKGSSLSRGLLQTEKYQTRRQFETAQSQVLEQVIDGLKTFNVKTVTLNIYVGNASTREACEWTGKFKDLTEALKNTLLIASGCILLFGSTVMISKGNPEKVEPPHEVAITQLAPNTLLQTLPKVFEATKPEDFPEIIQSLHAVPPQVNRRRAGRKFRDDLTD